MPPNPFRAVRDYLRGEDLKVRLPEPWPPEAPAPETAAREPGTAERKLYYETLPPAMFSYGMIGPNGPLIHGPGAYAMYGGYSGAPVASNSAVFACLAVIVKAYWAAPLRVFRAEADGTEAWLPDHPFQTLADDPHEALTKKQVEWWRLVALHVHGNAYFRKVRAEAGPPRWVQLISPTRMVPVTTPADRAAGVFISHYRHEYESAKYEDIPPEDVVHFRFGVDESDFRVGCSPLQRAIREVCTDDEASQFTKALLTNMGAVGLVVTLPPNVPMTRDEAEELRTRIDDKFSADGRGRTTVLTNGATMTQTGFNPQQMNLKDVHRIPEERIAAVLGVHPMVAGLGAGLERSTFSNFAEARDALYEQTIVPLYEADAETWTKSLLRPDFDTDKAVQLRYDLDDVDALQEDMDKKYARLSVAVEKGWITKDEARAEVGFDPLPDGLGEAKPDPVPMLPPPPGADGPPASARGESGDGEPTPAKALAERKARLLRAFPAAQDTIRDLTVPAVERDLAAYLAGQKTRVQSRLRGG